MIESRPNSLPRDSAARAVTRRFARDVKSTLGRALFVAGISDAECARLTGIARSRINLIKNGRAVATLRESLVLAKLLGRSVDELFRLTAESAPVSGK